MRKIKFRGWDNENKVMHENIAVANGGIGYITLGKDNIAPKNVMQFTGLLDKNGKEIYEGDIVYHIENVVVDVIAGSERKEPEGIFTEVKIPDIYLACGGDLPDADELEIIGNIYENPNLLK